MLKLGQINFINCLPVNMPLARKGLSSIAGKFEYEIIEGPPSKLNEMLKNGELDLAPISSYEFLKNRDLYQNLEGISISSKKQADSVLFFCDLEFWNKENKVIHITDKSATSVNLLKIILEKSYGLDISKIEFLKFSENKRYDAKLVIGDEALQEKEPYEEVIDLGTKWFELTNLPMVFAVWAVNKNSALYQDPKLFKAFNEEIAIFKNQSLDELYPDMIIEAYKVSGLSKTLLKQYFRNLDYNFNEKHQESLKLFSQFLGYNLVGVS